MTHFPAEIWSSTALRKRMDSVWEWHCTQRPITAPSEHAERGEQRGGAVPLVVMRHARAAAGLERQPRPGAVERLNLALFVEREHHGTSRRIDKSPAMSTCTG
jgi:hypothetical protein